MPDTCVFCGCEIADQSEGFMAHVKDDGDCHRLWAAWRRFVQEDWGGE